MEHRKSVLKQSELVDAKPQAVADSACIYVFVCSHVFPQGETKFHPEALPSHYFKQL